VLDGIVFGLWGHDWGGMRVGRFGVSIRRRMQTRALPALGGLLRQAALFAGLALVFVIGILSHPKFLSIDNQRDVLGQVSINGILAVGMTLVILSGGIDLSVGSVLSLCTVVCAMLLMRRPDGGPADLSRAHWLALAATALFLLWVGVAIFRRLRSSPGRIRLLFALAGLGVVLAVALNRSWVMAQVNGGSSTGVVLVVVPLVGCLMGLINGLVITRTRLQPFIVTLAMMVSAVGLAKLVAGHGGQIHAIYRGDAEHVGAPPSFEQLGATILTVGQERLRSGRIHELKLLPVPGLFLLGAWSCALFVLWKLPLGRYIYAVGGNEEAARLAGVQVDRVKIFVYGASGLLAGLAGVLYCAQYTQGKPDAGLGKELDAIAAVVIGGTSLMGGRGSILGTLVGVMIFGYLTNLLQLRAVSSEIQDILKGAIIVVAAVIQSGSFLTWLRGIWSGAGRRPGQ